jgi:hypothetical protein
VYYYNSATNGAEKKEKIPCSVEITGNSITAVTRERAGGQQCAFPMRADRDCRVKGSREGAKGSPRTGVHSSNVRVVEAEVRTIFLISARSSRLRAFA